jgi:hypothetical protein
MKLEPGILALWAVATAIPASADQTIDEFSAVGIFENPWPFVQHASGQSPEFYEVVGDGVIEGEAGMIRETDIFVLPFEEGSAAMGVDTRRGVFDYAASSYGLAIQNDLNADLSGETGIRIDFEDVVLAEEGYVQVSAFVRDSNGVQAESQFEFITTDGSHSILLEFSAFDAADLINLADLTTVAVDIFASGGTSFALERLIAVSGAAADVNGDGTVDVQDLVAVIMAWGPCTGCPEDGNGDGQVDVLDLVEVILNYD